MKRGGHDSYYHPIHASPMLPCACIQQCRSGKENASTKVAEIILEGIQKPFHAGRQCGIWPIQPTNQHRPLDPSVANVAGAFDLLSLRRVRDTLRFSSRTSPASQQSNGMLWSGAPMLTACLSPGIPAYSKLVAVGFRCWDQIARSTMTQSLSKFERPEGGGAIAHVSFLMCSFYPRFLTPPHSSKSF